MKEIFEPISLKIVENIKSKENSSQVALQFIFEELDTACWGNSDFRDMLRSLYFEETEYAGAINRTWSDVSGVTGPKQLMIKHLGKLVQDFGEDIAELAKFDLLKFVAHHFKLGRFYINPEVRLAKKPPNLFGTLETDQNMTHPHFKTLMSEEFTEVRKVVSRWASGFEDRDNKLDKEFQATFNSSFWEIYLFQCFKDLEMEVDFSKPAPDFSVKTKTGKLLNIEAVTANHANYSSPEWAHQRMSNDKDFLNFSCVRILNAIDGKHRKFLSSYSSLIHVQGAPFIVAVAPFEQPMFFNQNNEAIIRVLYGKGIDKHNNWNEVYVPTVLKKENVSLQLGIFTSDKYKHISAVIFSTIATIGKAISQTSMPRSIRCCRYHDKIGALYELTENSRYYETHLDGLQIHHNPFATHKIPPESFNKYEITHYYYDIESGQIDNQQKPYTIVSRSLWPPGLMSKVGTQ
jgi:hypothetical protein